MKISLIDAGQRNICCIQNELEQLKSCLEKLETLLAQKEEAPSAQQLSLLP